MSITTQTRFESLSTLNRSSLYDMILSVLRENKEGLTAREIAVNLYNKGLIKDNTRQATAPRLTELEEKGFVKVIDKRKDNYSNKSVAVYSLV